MEVDEDGWTDKGKEKASHYSNWQSVSDLFMSGGKNRIKFSVSAIICGGGDALLVFICFLPFFQIKYQLDHLSVGFFLSTIYIHECSS